jgi:hypothetical protein
MHSETIKTIYNNYKTISSLDDFNYQGSLTSKLDEQCSDFDQDNNLSAK